jgi:hypothetical protein
LQSPQTFRLSGKPVEGVGSGEMVFQGTSEFRGHGRWIRGYGAEVKRK